MQRDTHQVLVLYGGVESSSLVQTAAQEVPACTIISSSINIVEMTMALPLFGYFAPESII